MRQVAQVRKLSEEELRMGVDMSGSWHNDYRHSCVVIVKGLDKEVTEDQVFAVFEQWGRIVHFHRPDTRPTNAKAPSDPEPGPFAFIGYEDQRSTVLAVDNANGITLNGKLLLVDHVKDYSVPRGAK